MDLTPYTNEDAAELLRNVTGLVEAPSNCDGLRVCLNHAVRHALELAADECDAMDAHHAGGALLATAKRMTLADLGVLAATAERNGTTHAFQAVALEWCGKAQAEIERLTVALKKANDQAEHFERLWYLTNEDAARYAFAKTLEGQVVTMETFKVRGAAELDQALDDAMMEAADAQNEAGPGA